MTYKAFNTIRPHSPTMVIPYRICLKPGCGQSVKIDTVSETALTCDRYACNKYMKLIANANIENQDGYAFDMLQVSTEYYKRIKVFDVTMDKEAMKTYTDDVKKTFTQIHHGILTGSTVFSHGFTSNKRSRQEFEVEMDDEPATLPTGMEAFIKKNIIRSVRDITDDAFNAIADKESLAQFIYETVLAPMGLANDFNTNWMAREEYGGYT